MTLLKAAQILFIIGGLIIFGCSNDGIVDPNAKKNITESGTADIRSYVIKDALFQFISDSAVAVVNAPDMETVSQTLYVSGDSSNGRINGIPAGKGRIITVTVYNSEKNKWCTGKDTIDIIKNITSRASIKLKQVQPNIITDDTIRGHSLKADEIWRGNCFLKGDITVPLGIQLTIMPGATIKVTSGNLDQDSGFLAKGRVEIYGRGTLTARGDVGNIITLISDSTFPKRSAWWGIGWSDGTVDMAYCSISCVDYGIFFLTNSTGSVENSYISYARSGVTDYGLDCSYSKLTFSDVEFPISISGRNKKVDISMCNFPQASLVDINLTDSNQTASVRDCNFASREFYNLYISSISSGDPKGCVITADNCYNIYKVNNTTGAITIINPALLPIPDAGCGFAVPKPVVDKSLNKRRPIDPSEMVKRIREIRERDLKACGFRYFLIHKRGRGA